MSVTTILIIAGVLVGFFVLLLIGGFFLWLINRSTVKAAVKEAVKNAKPTTINNGTIINHNYGREMAEGSPESDEAYLQMSRCAGEFAKQLLPKAEETHKAANRRRNR